MGDGVTIAVKSGRLRVKKGVGDERSRKKGVGSGRYGKNWSGRWETIPLCPLNRKPMNVN